MHLYKSCLVVKGLGQEICIFYFDPFLLFKQAYVLNILLVDIKGGFYYWMFLHFMSHMKDTILTTLAFTLRRIFLETALFQWLCLRTVHANSNELSPETRLFDNAFQSEWI